MRNLDITTLRALVAVADHGGVTRAAAILNLTQSAVSMQIKRLEEMLDLALFDRGHRRVSLTGPGEQLVRYARRILSLNDEAVARLTEDRYEGELRLGVPHDIVYPVVPRVLKQFNAAYPRINVHLRSSSTMRLHEEFARGEVDVILTTEESLRPGGETLTEMAVLSEDDRAVEALVSADLAVGALLEDSIPPHQEAIEPGNSLPDLGVQKINLYARPGGDRLLDPLSEMLRQGFVAQPAPLSRQTA